MQTLPLSLTLASFPHPFRWVCVCLCVRAHIHTMHGLNCLTFARISQLVSRTASRPHRVPLRTQSCRHTFFRYMNAVCWTTGGWYVLVVRPKSCPHCTVKRGWKSGFLWGFEVFSSPPLSPGSCQAKVFPFSDWLQRSVLAWRAIAMCKCVRVVPRLCD